MKIKNIISRLIKKFVVHIARTTTHCPVFHSAHNIYKNILLRINTFYRRSLANIYNFTAVVELSSIMIMHNVIYKLKE